MVIFLANKVSTHPADWAYAYCWWYGGQYLDFLRIKEIRRPKESNILSTHNEFKFITKCEDSSPAVPRPKA